MANFEVTGTVKLISPTTTVGKNDMKKRAIVLTEDAEKYPQDIKIEFIKDICDELDSVKEGDTLTVSVNVRGSEWQGKYYVNLQGWRVQTGAGQPATAGAGADDGDLPF
jgi:hypothetical protein